MAVMMDGVNQAPTTEQWDRSYDRRADAWLFFAGTVLGIAGIMRIFDAIWAFTYHGGLVNNLQDGLVGSQLHDYAWLWLGVGSAMFLASFAVLVRSQIGRWVGLVAAVVGAVSAVVWFPYYPVWSLLYVTLAVLVFYALAVHGSRLPKT